MTIAIVGTFALVLAWLFAGAMIRVTLPLVAAAQINVLDGLRSVLTTPAGPRHETERGDMSLSTDRHLNLKRLRLVWQTTNGLIVSRVSVLRSILAKCVWAQRSGGICLRPTYVWGRLREAAATPLTMPSMSAASIPRSRNP